jgi:hypothetical protein
MAHKDATPNDTTSLAAGLPSVSLELATAEEGQNSAELAESCNTITAITAAATTTAIQIGEDFCQSYDVDAYDDTRYWSAMAVVHAREGSGDRAADPSTVVPRATKFLNVLSLFFRWVQVDSWAIQLMFMPAAGTHPCLKMPLEVGQRLLL